MNTLLPRDPSRPLLAAWSLDGEQRTALKTRLLRYITVSAGAGVTVQGKVPLKFERRWFSHYM